MYDLVGSSCESRRAGLLIAAGVNVEVGMWSVVTMEHSPRIIDRVSLAVALCTSLLSSVISRSSWKRLILHMYMKMTIGDWIVKIGRRKFHRHAFLAPFVSTAI